MRWTVRRMAWVAALAMMVENGIALEMTLVPSCPDPDAIVVLHLEERDAPPVIIPSDPRIVRNGTHLRITLDTTRAVFAPQPPTSSVIGLGQLAAGEYEVEVFHRFATATGYEPEGLWETFQFAVGGPPDAAPCSASVIEAKSEGFAAAQVSSAFASSFEVVVIDGQSRVVPDATVILERIDRPDDRLSPPAQRPDAIFSTVETNTDSQGVARFSAVANAVAGTYQYVARIKDSVAPGAVFALSNRAPGSPARTDARPVVEYYNGTAPTANHRYTTSLAVVNEMRVQHWVSEGYGANGVAMCAM